MFAVVLWVGGAIASKGPDSPEVAAAIDSTLFVSRVDLAVLIIVVFDMALKPGCNPGSDG